MRGFETIGSATLIAYDDVPVLTTDPWINGDAYFGSWGHDYAIPAGQMCAIKSARFHWFSHGHPDHLNVGSLPDLAGGSFLVANHYGSRIARELRSAGYNVEVLRDWEWRQLSPGIRACTVANQNQDSILLIDINGRLVIDANDSPEFGEAWRTRQIARRYPEVYLLQLHAWGGADMLNLFAPDGTKLTSRDALRRPIAPRAQRAALAFGATKFIPFSSFHRYQRTDSAWANALVPELADYQSDAIPNAPQMLPAFVRVDCETDAVTPLEPPRSTLDLRTSGECGDSWSDPLEAEDKRKITRYFQARESLQSHFGFIEVKAGPSNVTVDLNPALRGRGISFEAPRNSLMTAIEHEVFDDMLIGNFMRTTLHGVDGLYPHFTPNVAKYADNGGAKSKAELRRYFSHYYLRDPLARIMKQLSDSSEQVLRKAVPENTAMFRTAKRFYYSVAARS
ncbi:MAG TPA: hypothetical protein VGH03_17100 [Caulobacteraceae bacterium]|jgi:hypothetical protein